MTKRQTRCGGCQHLAFHHRAVGDRAWTACRRRHCECSGFSTLNAQDRAELEAMGIKPAPPDSWIYQQGTVFFMPDQVAEPKAPPPARRPLRPLPPDDPIYSSGALIFFLKSPGEPTMADEPPCD